MFDQVLSMRGTLPENHYGSGVVIAAFVYAGLVAFGAWAQNNVRAVDRQDVMVSFVTRAPVRAPPRPAVVPAALAAAPPAARAGPRLKAASDRPAVVLAQAIVAPTQIPQARPPEQDPVADSFAERGDAAASDYEAPAVPGGIGGPVVDAAEVAVGTAEARPPVFEEARMTHPRFVSGPSPQYTQKALDREVEGTIEVRCIVTMQGRVRDCRVVRSLPFMDRAVVDALERRIYEPATLDGRPIDVYYRFKIPLRLTE